MSNTRDRSLLVLILDVTPTPWSHRQNCRTARDAARSKENKSTIGPATLTQDVLPSLTTFLLSYAACHRENALVVTGVAGGECAVLYPRKGTAMERMTCGSTNSGGGGGKIDPRELEEGLKLGVVELMGRCERLSNDKTSKRDNNSTAAITAATSQALCIIHRFLKSSGSPELNGDTTLGNSNDEGVLSLLSSRTAKSKSAQSHATAATQRRHAIRTARGLPSPRILIVQASDDRSTDYNSFMNCVFCASKLDVVIDGCFIPSGMKGMAQTSSFLEQACDRTGGVFTEPKKQSQIMGALAEVFTTVFLPPLGIRGELNLLKANRVDFRARCFGSGVSLKEGVVCSLCLSIFKKEPEDGVCMTCGGVVEDKLEAMEKKMMAIEQKEKGDGIESGGENVIEHVTKKARVE